MLENGVFDKSGALCQFHCVMLDSELKMLGTRERAPVHKSPLYLSNWLSNRKKLFAFLIEQTVSTHTHAALSSERMKPVGGIL